MGRFYFFAKKIATCQICDYFKYSDIIISDPVDVTLFAGTIGSLKKIFDNLKVPV